MRIVKIHLQFSVDDTYLNPTAISAIQYQSASLSKPVWVVSMVNIEVFEVTDNCAKELLELIGKDKL